MSCDLFAIRCVRVCDFLLAGFTCTQSDCRPLSVQSEFPFLILSSVLTVTSMGGVAFSSTVPGIPPPLPPRKKELPTVALAPNPFDDDDPFGGSSNAGSSQALHTPVDPTQINLAQAQRAQNSPDSSPRGPVDVRHVVLASLHLAGSG